MKRDNVAATEQKSSYGHMLINTNIFVVKGWTWNCNRNRIRLLICFPYVRCFNFYSFNSCIIFQKPSIGKNILHSQNKRIVIFAIALTFTMSPVQPEIRRR